MLPMYVYNRLQFAKSNKRCEINTKNTRKNFPRGNFTWLYTQLTTGNRLLKKKKTIFIIAKTILKYNKI